MRSLVIAIIVLLVLGTGFGIFLFLQPQTPVAAGPKAGGSRATGGVNGAPQALPHAPSTQPSESVIGEASGVWIQSFDKDSGALISEFRAARYDPPQQGQVHVAKPEALFYMKDGQVMKVSADTGDVVMPEQTKRNDRISSIEAQPPTRGVLNNVTIDMLKDPDSTTPLMTVSIPILAFDNDTLRMNTVQTQIDGRDVLADRVPVTVRGRDYDFDGEGLIVRYNQRDQRLEYLEVTHGKKLVVKNASSFSPVPSVKPAAGASSRRMTGALPMQFADADPDAAAKAAAEEKARRERKARRAAATRPAATRPVSTNEIVAYRALFQNDVRIVEGDKPIGTADRMLATFTFLDDEPKPAPAPEHRPAATQPTTRRVRPTTAPGTSPATSPAAAAPAQPITITWTGKLVVTPAEFEKSGLRSPADRIVEFVGSPVKLDREGAMVEAASVAVGAVGNRFIARSSTEFPIVTLKDPAGMLLKTTALDFSGDEAIVQGQSSAEIALAPADRQQAPQKLLTSWRDKATLHLYTNAAGQRAIDRAVFEGTVDVQHPQLKLSSDALSLAFAPVEGKQQPALTSVDARGSVKATVADDNGVAQTIAADKLVLATEPQKDGTLLLKRLDAAGNVVAQEPKQTITADQLAATFSAPAPGTDPKDAAAKMNIDELTAQGRVNFKSADGATAAAQIVTVRKSGDGQVVTLMGQPAALQQKESRLTGPKITFDTVSGDITVFGAGSATGLAQATTADPKAPSKPVEVSWSQSLDYRAADNRADVVGDVSVLSVNKDGAIDRATGKRMTLLLADDPKAAPATKPAPGMFGGAGAAKIVKAITLDGDVEVSSLLYSPTNELLRRVVVQAPAVNVDMLPTGDLGAVSINSGGRMLYEDRQTPATTQPASSAPGSAMRGVVAIEWKKSMVYDPATRRATLDGDVWIVQREPGRDQVEMKAERLVAEMNEPAAGQQASVKRIVADRGASFASKQLNFDAAEAVYEPDNNRVIARGSARQPVQVHDANGATSGSFEELWWNLKEGRPERLKNVSASVRN